MAASRSLLRSSAGLVLASGIGLALGLLREMAIAFGLGANLHSDAYFIALIPVTILTAIGTDMGLALVPLYIEWNVRVGPSSAWLSFRGIWRQVALLSIGFVAITVLAAPVWVPAVAPGAPRESHQTAVRLVYVLAPGLCLILPSLLWHARANSHRRFGKPQVATYAPNLGVVVATLALVGSFGAVAVALGQSGGLIAQAAALWLLSKGARDARPCALPTAPTAAGHTFFATWGLVTLGSLMSKVELFLQRYYASQLGAGEISVVNYAQRLSYLPNMLFTAAVAAVLFPHLSELALTSKAALRRLLVRLSLGGGAALGLAAGVIFGLRGWIVNTLLEYGRFSATDAARTAEVLAWFCLGILPIGLVLVLLRTALVLRITWLYALGGVASLAVYWATAEHLAPTMGAAALGAANAAGNGTLALILCVGVLSATRRR